MHMHMHMHVQWRARGCVAARLRGAASHVPLHPLLPPLASTPARPDACACMLASAQDAARRISASAARQRTLPLDEPYAYVLDDLIDGFRSFAVAREETAVIPFDLMCWVRHRPRRMLAHGLLDEP